MRRIIDECDVCKITRTESNHWLLMFKYANASPYFVRWDDHRAGEDGIGHICGDGCAHKQLDEWLNSQHDIRVAARQGDQDAPAIPIEDEYPKVEEEAK